jgi:hypothetical protein
MEGKPFQGIAYARQVTEREAEIAGVPISTQISISGKIGKVEFWESIELCKTGWFKCIRHFIDMRLQLEAGRKLLEFWGNNQSRGQHDLESRAKVTGYFCRCEPVTYDEHGNLVMDVGSDEANADWMASARLLKRAQQGNEDAARELERRENTPMWFWVDD